MAEQLEIAHSTPGRTRLRWCGVGTPPEQLLASLAASPSVRRVDYRPATGSLVLIHDAGFGLDRVSDHAEQFGLAISEKPLPVPRALPSRARSNGARGGVVLPTEPETASASGIGANNTSDKLTPIVAEVEAVVLLGLILGWIRDWLAGRNLAFGTVVLVVLSTIALVQFWWRRRLKKEAAEPELELIFA